MSTMPTPTPQNITPKPSAPAAEHAGSSHHYVRATVQEIRRHGEPSVPPLRAA